VIIFDKTGMLTEGKPQVLEVVASGNPLTQDELLRFVAYAEQSSEHPLAHAIVEKAKRRTLVLQATTDFEAIPGHGIKAAIAGKTLLVGNRKLMQHHKVSLDGFGERRIA
jgi:Cu+-exporting ATPase